MVSPEESLRRREAERDFRALIVEHGIVTEEQAKAVGFQAVNPSDYPDVPRCHCEACKDGRAFMAFSIEQGVLSEMQIEAVIVAFNTHAKPFIPASTDVSTWRRNAWQG